MKVYQLSTRKPAQKHTWKNCCNYKNQFRKSTDIPYIVHPYSVAMNLLLRGYAEELIIAGFLHDTVEDGSVELIEIREKFGEKVAGIVEACREHDGSAAWEKRKQHTLNRLKTAPLDIRIVACADKLHNILSIVIVTPACYPIKTFGYKFWRESIVQHRNGCPTKAFGHDSEGIICPKCF